MSPVQGGRIYAISYMEYVLSINTDDIRKYIFTIVRTSKMCITSVAVSIVQSNP